MSTTPENPETAKPRKTRKPRKATPTGPMVLLSQADIAELLGLAVQSIRMYRGERYKHTHPTPPPAFVIGDTTQKQVPGWLPEQAQDWKNWNEQRGHGRWDGPDRHDKQVKDAEAELDAALKEAGIVQARVQAATKALADARAKTIVTYDEEQ